MDLKPPFWPLKVFCAAASFWVGFSSTNALAEQNFFNIPSGQLTPPKDVFYQHQLNTYRSFAMTSKQHFAFGLADSWEAGVNLLNLAVRPKVDETQATNSPAGAIVTANLQKQFLLNEGWSANIGTQLGLVVNGLLPTHFTYGLVSWESQWHLRLTLGAYLSNSRYLGAGSEAGFLAGYELPLTQRWFLMGDFVSGTTESSVAVIGAYYNVSRYFQLCAGIQVPAFNDRGATALVLEINLFSDPLKSF